MVVPVMGSAQRYGELVADLALHRAWLSESQVVGVGWAALADEARLGCDELQVRLIPMVPFFGNGQRIVGNGGKNRLWLILSRVWGPAFVT